MHEYEEQKVQNVLNVEALIMSVPCQHSNFELYITKVNFGHMYCRIVFKGTRLQCYTSLLAIFT